MEKEDIQLADVHRILFGNAPPEFLVEVFFRTLIVYTLLLIAIRWMGKRMAGQLTIAEISVMIMLGAIVSSPMQMPDKGVLEGLLILLGIVLLQRGLTYFSVKNKRIEKLILGDSGLLVKDGVLQLDNMKAARISHQQLFAQLRDSKIYNLKKVKRLYLEACGIFSVFKDEEEKPGLSTYPPTDKVMFDNQKRTDCHVCINCGYIDTGKVANTCPLCHQANWEMAII